MTKRLSGGFRPNARQQRGIAAVEFALVFGLLFFALYGIVTFAVMLYTQQVVSRSAEDGARAALRLGQSVQPGDSRVQDAVYEALAFALITPIEAGTGTEQKKDWLRRKMAPPVVALPSGGTVVVTVTYPYGANSILPSITSWLDVTNAQLTGKATVARPAS
jgi:Flp pilus assembly protein TadG